MKLAKALIASALALLLSACTVSSGGPSATPIATQPPAPTATVPTATAPISETNVSAMRSLLKTYMAAVAAGSSEEATSVFISDDPAVVSARISQDIAEAKPKGAAVEKSIRVMWMVDGVLAPTGGAGSVTDSDKAKLVSLSSQYSGAAILVFEPVSGPSRTYFAVVTDQGARLIP